MAQIGDAYDALLDCARDEVRARRLERAEEMARQALALEPERAPAYNVLAAIRELQSRHAEAMDLLRAGLAVEPAYGPAQQNLERLRTIPRSDPVLLGDESDGGDR